MSPSSSLQAIDAGSPVWRTRGLKINFFYRLENFCPPVQLSSARCFSLFRSLARFCLCPRLALSLVRFRLYSCYSLSRFLFFLFFFLCPCHCLPPPLLILSLVSSSLTLYTLCDYFTHTHTFSLTLSLSRLI